MTGIENRSLPPTGTYPNILDISLLVISFTSRPSTITVPEEGLLILFMHFIRVDFPTPFGPRMQYRPGPSILKLMPDIICLDGL